MSTENKEISKNTITREELTKMFKEIPSWARQENFSPAVTKILTANPEEDEALKEKAAVIDKFFEVHGRRLEKLIKSKSSQERDAFQREMVSQLHSLSVLDDKTAQENINWLNIRAFGHGRGIKKHNNSIENLIGLDSSE